MFRQAVAAVDADAWIQAIQAKKMALERNNVWEVVDIPSQAHLINSIWVFKRVFDGKGKLIKHKARVLDFNLKVYADASYANCPTMQPSHTGLMVFLDDTLIHWKSQRQFTVSSSSTKEEYKALYEGTKQILWLQKLFNDLSLVLSKLVLSLLGNNQPAIAMAKNPM
ncbi:hypothetical protein O181_050648 [Austropuccinia psidii MF-1]|uniref:Reverse transcriptase Ty1/copia-type domain-containing protein n=1 Tax=Austropuccinia psidii MF-1 TaxID=1389203 RepID=A0A9Q3DZI3_9BASI|nr:hypothetical protein [Austropuccinia psidii MF-1]